MAKRQRQTKYPVGERALILRINRRLKASGRMLHVARGARAEQQLGHFFIVDDRNNIVAHNVDLTELARKLGALKPWEEAQEMK
jgi:hypothetical protein